MQIFFQKEQTIEENLKEIKVQAYLNKYLEELQRHFYMSDKKMRKILFRVYKDLGPFGYLNAIIKKRLSMIKSFIRRKFIIKRE